MANNVIEVVANDPVQVITVTLPTPGPRGPSGADGPVNVLTIGDVETLPPGSNAAATISGVSPNQVLNLSLPRGAGLILGGTAEQVLVKHSSTDYDVAWETATDASTPNSLVRRDSTGGSTFEYVSSYNATVGATPVVASDVTRKDYVDSRDTSTLTSAKSYADGKAAIAGDLGGTAAVPTVISGAHHTHTSSQLTDAAVAGTPSTLIVRDPAGRAQIVDPVANQDIASKLYVDTRGISTATANSVIKRDAAARAQVADPAVAADIATKNYVDTTTGPTVAAVAAATDQSGASTLVKRTAGSTFGIGGIDVWNSPTAVQHATRKDYVDTQDALRIPLTQKGAASGVPSLDATSGLLVPAYGEATEIAQPANPAAGKQRYWFDSTTHTLNFVDSTGTTRRAGVHWGSGTAYPNSTALRAGDTFLRTDVGNSLMVFDGIYWSLDGRRPVFANIAALPAASGLYDGFTAFVTSKNVEYRVWNIGGTLTWKSSRPFGKIYMSSNWTPVTGDQGVANWPTVANWDTDNMWSGTATGYFIIPVPGIYRVRFHTAVTQASGNFYARVNRNPITTAPYTGATIANDGGAIYNSGSDDHFNAVNEYALVAGDRIGAQIYSSVAPTIGAGWEGCGFSVEFVNQTPSSSSTV